jgi:hypothetical protein
MSRRLVRWGALLALVLVFAACSDGGSAGPGARNEERVTVLPDLDAEEFVINVYATDTGYEQPIVHVPAGRYIKLVFRDHGVLEHHYRVIGLVPSQLRWVVFPTLSAEDIPSMSEEELRAHGFDPDMPIDDLEHTLHHLSITYSPTRPASRGAIKPLGTEVHAITRRGSQDVVYFYALTTGTYDVVDAAHPEITGKMVVYLPPDATVAGG